MLRRLRSLGCNARGVSFVEIALSLPLLAMLFVGAYEGWRIISARSRAETAAHALADLVAQSDTTVTEAEVTSLLNATSLLIAPYSLSTDARAIVSTVTAGATPTVNWQRCAGGLSYASRLGAAGSTPNFAAAGLQTPIGEATVIVAEIAIDFRPALLGRFFPSHRFQRAAILRGRLRTPTTVNAGGTTSAC